MKIQKTGPDSVLMVLNAAELQDDEDLRRRACEALASEGIPAGTSPEVTAYTAGGKTVVFVCAGDRAIHILASTARTICWTLPMRRSVCFQMRVRGFAV